MKKKLLIIIFVVVFCVSFFDVKELICIVDNISVVEAHSGRTDKRGGHKDTQNKSGLGFYHYHCGGYPAHLHSDGVCPYSGGAKISSSSNNTVSNNTTSNNLSVISAPVPSMVISNVVTNMLVGDEQELKIQLKNCNDSEYVIESNNEDVVSVNSDNSLLAKGIGTAKITIKNSKVSRTISITVKEIPVETIKVENIKEKIQLGTEEKLEVEILPMNATYKKYNLISSNEDIVSIVDNKTIKACGVGVAELVFEAENGVKSTYEINVYEVFPEKIETNVDDLLLEAGKNEKIEITILPENANNKSVDISVSDEDIICLEGNKITAKSDGVTSIVIKTCNGIVKKIPVEVFHEPVTDIYLDTDNLESFASNYYIDCKEELVVNAAVIPEDATYQEIKWVSSNDEIVKIENNNFVVTGTGKVCLTAYASDNVQKEFILNIINKDAIAKTSGCGAVGIASVVGANIFRKKRHITKS